MADEKFLSMKAFLTAVFLALSLGIGNLLLNKFIVPNFPVIGNFLTIGENVFVPLGAVLALWIGIPIVEIVKRQLKL